MYYGSVVQIIQNNFGEHLLEQYETGQNQHYNDALYLKENSRENWETLIQQIKVIESVKRTRDLAGGAAPQTNKLLIGLNGVQEGIILNISYLTKLIGFYYCDYNSIPLIPIVDSNYKQISYYPYNNLQEQLARDVLSLTDTLFPEFFLFNNLFAF